MREVVRVCRVYIRSNRPDAHYPHKSAPFRLSCGSMISLKSATVRNSGFSQQPLPYKQTTPKLSSSIRQLQHRQDSRRSPLQVRSSSDRGGSFTAGFLVGGIIFGSLGFLFAPQISRALLTEDQKLKLPRFLEDEVRDPEQTKQELSDKIAQLNAAIDEVSSQMKAKDPKPEEILEELTA